MNDCKNDPSDEICFGLYDFVRSSCKVNEIWFEGRLPTSIQRFSNTLLCLQNIWELDPLVDIYTYHRYVKGYNLYMESDAI